jgi:hypothetical protein
MSPRCIPVAASLLLLLQMRERTVRDYQACLDQLLTWQPAGQALYIPGAPRHLPVAVQQSWLSSSSSSSSSGLHVTEAPTDSATAAAAADSKPAWSPSPEEQRTLQQISSAVQQQLGQPLPTRAFAGERGQLLSCLAAAAVSERLRRWVSCCGRGYVQQLVTKEPSLLAHEPQALLQTLEALNSVLELPTADCVAFALKHVVLVGLDASELQQRLQGLRGACGYDAEQAVRLAVAAPELLTLHPDNIEVREMLSFERCWTCVLMPWGRLCCHVEPELRFLYSGKVQVVMPETVADAPAKQRISHACYFCFVCFVCRSGWRRSPSCCQKQLPSCRACCCAAPSCCCALHALLRAASKALLTPWGCRVGLRAGWWLGSQAYCATTLTRCVTGGVLLLFYVLGDWMQPRACFVGRPVALLQAIMLHGASRSSCTT